MSVKIATLEDTPQTNEQSKIQSIAASSATSVKSLEITPFLPIDIKTENETSKQLQYIASKNRQSEIEDEDFYHGYMTRSEAERLLIKKGQFLVRKTDIKGEHCFVVSTNDGEKVKHLKIHQTKHHSNYWLHEFCFDSIGSMIAYHRQKTHPVHNSGLILLDFVKREQWELYHEQIDLSGGKLGSGEFGEVFSGFLSTGVFTSRIPVAVKTLRGENMSSDDRVAFLREANVMLKLKHEHIVRLYGVATQRQPIMIVMERADGGSLLSRLKKDKTLTIGDKETFCHEIADGMAYLEDQQVIHRDLAARNVLLSDKSCKISDFGLSLLGKLHRENKLSKVPVRWLAPETLTQGVYSSKTDVWSFGVVIFEIFSNAAIPYGEIKKLSVVAMKVQQGLRLSLSEEASSTCREMMTSCFEANPEKRVSFKELKKRAPMNLPLKLKSFFSK